MSEIDDPPKMFVFTQEPVRTSVFRDPHAKLAFAILKDALELACKLPKRGGFFTPQLQIDVDDARAWVLDTTSDRVFSLSWCCMALSVYGGTEWRPEAIADAFRAGNVGMFQINNMPSREGGRSMRAVANRVYGTRRERAARRAAALGA